MCLGRGCLRGRALAGCVSRNRGRHLGNRRRRHAAACFAHVIGGANQDYTTTTRQLHRSRRARARPGLVRPALGADITWRVALPGGGAFPVSSVGPTFWFGGTVKDSNPKKLGGEGFLELQFYPDSLIKRCTAGRRLRGSTRAGVYTACSPVWTLTQQFGKIREPAAFNGMLTNAAGKARSSCTGATSSTFTSGRRRCSAYREQVVDETTGETSSVLVLNSPSDGPLTPAFDTNEIGNSLDWGGVWDTPMAFVYEIGHADLYGDHPGQFCIPGQTFCGSFNHDNWAGQQPLRIFDVTFGDGSHPAELGRRIRHRRQGRGARQLVRRPHRLHGLRWPVLHLPVVLMGRTGVSTTASTSRTPSTTSARSTSSRRRRPARRTASSPGPHTARRSCASSPTFRNAREGPLAPLPRSGLTVASHQGSAPFRSKKPPVGPSPAISA